MNSVEKPHYDVDSSVSSVLRRSSVFRISKLFLTSSQQPLGRCGMLEVDPPNWNNFKDI